MDEQPISLETPGTVADVETIKCCQILRINIIHSHTCIGRTHKYIPQL